MKVRFDRVSFALDLAERYEDLAQKRRFLLPVYEDLKVFMWSFDSLSPAADAPPRPVLTALNVVSPLLRGLLAELRTSASLDGQRQRLAPGDPDAVQERVRVTQSLKPLVERSREIEDYKQFLQKLSNLPEVLDSSSSFARSNREATHRNLLLTLDLAAIVATAAFDLHYHRLHTHDLPQAMQQSIQELWRLLVRGSELITPLGEFDARGAEERSGQARELLQVLNNVGRTSDRFAQAAAENWSAETDESEQWRHALEFADALATFTSANLERAGAVTREQSRAVASVAQLHGTGEASMSSESTPSTADEASGSLARTRRSRRPRPNRRRRAEQSAAGPVIAPIDPRELALKKAESLRRSHPLKLETVRRLNADVLAVARDCDEDSGAIEAMVSGGHEPYNIAHAARNSVRRWFGDIKPLKQSCSEMSLLMEADPSDEVMQARIAELNERIEALELVHRRIDADEADALKRHEFPRALHLQRMLDLDEIDDVAAPIKLPTAQDEGDLGTLFELQIQPRALVDGSPAAPLFLHMHVQALKPVSVEQAMELPFEEFTAVHVKTERQKNLGRRWEEIQQRIGNFDARVHRGKVESPLLNRLRRMAGPPSNAG